MKHTPEPWKLQLSAVAWEIFGEAKFKEDRHILSIGREANARRIVACINACKGVPTEMLERVAEGKHEISIITPIPTVYLKDDPPKEDKP